MLAMTTETETPTITLGRSGLEVSRIAFGTWQRGGDWGSFDEREASEAIRHAHDVGINFFDTAQAYGYGESERLLGSALRDRLRSDRDRLVIATKGGLRIDEEKGQVRDSSPAWIRSGVESSLRQLGIDRIDLYQIHWPDPETPFAETAGALKELIEEGKIAHVGVSNFDAAEIEEFSRTLPVQTLQPPYHLFRRDVEDEILPYCAANDIGVLVYGPLAHGLLTGAISEDTEFGDDDWRSKSELFRGETLRGNVAVARRLEEIARRRGCKLSQLAIAWTLANPAVQVAIVGTRNAAHIAEAVAAADIELSADELAEIDGIMAEATPAPGPTPDSV
jgi:aryl-alcohol dehydrogenase-like predicted oxidoreductase